MAGQKTASPPAPGGTTSPTTGAARTAARPNPISRWSRSRALDGYRRPVNEVRTVQRIPYAEASRVLLRDSILDGMRDLLLTRDWSSITLSAVAGAAGISRQTIYNEFGSRQGLAQGYAMRLADRLVDAVEKAIIGNVGDIYAAFLEGFRDFFSESAADPLVTSLLSGETKPDL